MRAWAWLAGALLGQVRAPAAPPPPAPHAPLAPLPTLPSVSRVRIEVAQDQVLVIEDIALPRGEWRGGDLDLYVAFGAPGSPRAFDARLVPVPDGALEPAETETGEAVPIDRAPRRPTSAYLLLGRPQMAGAVLHLKEPAFRRALAPGGMAVIRVRTLLAMPAEDANAGREVIVRLGMASGPPLTLGRVQLVATDARPPITRAEARLCGPEADPYPLAIAVTSRPRSGLFSQQAGIAPVLSVRHATDDLCVRFYAQ